MKSEEEKIKDRIDKFNKFIEETNWSEWEEDWLCWKNKNRMKIHPVFF